MSEHSAIRLVSRQFEHHMAALDNPGISPAEKAVLYRNLAEHLKSWTKILNKEARANEQRALVEARRRTPGLESAA